MAVVFVCGAACHFSLPDVQNQVYITTSLKIKYGMFCKINPKDLFLFILAGRYVVICPIIRPLPGAEIQLTSTVVRSL